MPNVWTHILFSQDVMEKVESVKIEPTFQNYLHLGAQGPDPLFYHNFWPWQKDRRINNLGSIMHREKCGTVLLHMIEEAKDTNDATQTYIIGFITHHVLDRVTHPYVHYKAGYNDYNHQKLETIIDTLMMEKYRQFQTWKNPVTRMIDVGSQLDTHLATIMEKILKIHFGDQIKIDAGFYQKSYEDMKKVLTIVFDPNGWKTKLLSKIIPPISHRPIDDDVDYLNEKRETWCHSATNEHQHESFIDLYKQALDEASLLVKTIFNYWETESSRALNDVKELLGDISYDTGMPLEDRLENKYAEPIV
ncbi:zinc dependent phospholipase C family protein [Bacillaceae bacterium W0354]